MHKKCKCKNAMQSKYKSQIKCCKFKNANCRTCFWTPTWFTFRGRAGYAVSVAWFSCIQVQILELASHAICARMSFSSVWVYVPASTLNGHTNFRERVGGWLAQPPSPSPKLGFSEERGPISQGMTLPKAHFFGLFCCYLLFFLIAFFVFVFCLSFCGFFQKVSNFVWRQFGSGTFPFGWSPVHLAGVSLNIGRFSSASRVHLGPLFLSLMFPLSSAQVLLPCPG